MSHPQQGWAQPAPAEPAPASRKALGITAAVLGGVVGLAALVFGVWIGIIGVASGTAEFETFEGIAAFVGAFGGLFLLIGSIVHGVRRNAGRVLMAIGFVPTLAFAAILPLGPAVAGAAVIPLVLAFLSRSWCLPKQQAYPQQQYGYQYPQQYPHQQPNQQQWRQ